MYRFSLEVDHVYLVGVVDGVERVPLGRHVVETVLEPPEVTHSVSATAEPTATI